MAPRHFVRHAVLLLLILVVLTALAIWLGIGPVVHSMA
jgi:hypothetical protein